MSLRPSSRAHGLEVCALCGSSAVSATECTDRADWPQRRFFLRCGECGTWRDEMVGRRKARAMERRVRRDLQQMAHALGDGLTS